MDAGYGPWPAMPEWCLDGRRGSPPARAGVPARVLVAGIEEGAGLRGLRGGSGTAAAARRRRGVTRLHSPSPRTSWGSNITTTPARMRKTTGPMSMGSRIEADEPAPYVPVMYDASVAPRRCTPRAAMPV